MIVHWSLAGRRKEEKEGGRTRDRRRVELEPSGQLVEWSVGER